MWARLIEVYKMKCKASVIAKLKQDPKTLLCYFELEHGTQVGDSEDKWES